MNSAFICKGNREVHFIFNLQHTHTTHPLKEDVVGFMLLVHLNAYDIYAAELKQNAALRMFEFSEYGIRPQSFL